MNLFLRDVEQIRHNGSPIVLYGLARLGKRLFSFLRDMSVEISAVAVDQKYMPAIPQYQGTPVRSMEELLESGGSYNFIVGFNPLQSEEQIRERLLPSARQILMYDFGYGVCDDIHNSIAWYAGYSSCYKPHIDEVYGWLEDERSKDTLCAFIEQKQTGRYGIYARMHAPHQYFPDDVIRLERDCVFVDCGAYDGDTVLAFTDKLKRDGIENEYRAIYAFEPSQQYFGALQRNCSHLHGCRFLQKGVWDQECTLSFEQNRKESIIVEGGAEKIETATVDAVLQGGPASFLKMDVEGAELRALRGAAGTIGRYRPTLAVCIYHRPEDILTIPRLIKKMHPDYRLFIRGHSTLATNELVLYAV